MGRQTQLTIIFLNAVGQDALPGHAEDSGQKRELFPALNEATWDAWSRLGR